MIVLVVELIEHYIHSTRLNADVSVTSFKCYVCSPDSGRPEDMYTLRKSFPTHAIQPCSAYSRHNKHQYLLECPHGGNNGCLTKFAGR